MEKKVSIITKNLSKLLKDTKDKDLIKYIEENKTSLNQIDNNGYNSLLYALKYKRNENIIKLLINDKTDINHKNKNGSSALYYALIPKYNNIS